MGQESVERFRPTNGGFTGWLGLTLAALVVVLGLVNLGAGFPLPVIAAAVLMGVLVWAALLRPQVWIAGGELVLRNMLGTAAIPLAAIERVAVRQVLAVSAGGRRYVSPAIGKPRRRANSEWVRNAALDGSTSQGAGTRLGEVPYADYVADRISELARDARDRQGLRPGTTGQQAADAGVRRTRAWPEIVALVAAAGFVVVSVVA